MLFRKKYIIFTIFMFCNCLYLTSCQIYPLYYYKKRNDKRHIYPIEISPASDYIEKEVRDRLIFLMSHELTREKYKLNIKVTRRGNSNISSSGAFGKVGRINLQAVYSLQKSSNGEIIYKGRVHANSLFDFLNQEFSKIRIVQDTEEKTSKELAENIRVDIISFLKTID